MLCIYDKNIIIKIFQISVMCNICEEIDLNIGNLLFTT